MMNGAVLCFTVEEVLKECVYWLICVEVDALLYFL